MSYFPSSESRTGKLLLNEQQVPFVEPDEAGDSSSVFERQEEGFHFLDEPVVDSFLGFLDDPHMVDKMLHSETKLREIQLMQDAGLSHDAEKTRACQELEHACERQVEAVKARCEESYQQDLARLLQEHTRRVNFETEKVRKTFAAQKHQLDVFYLDKTQKLQELFQARVSQSQMQVETHLTHARLQVETVFSTSSENILRLLMLGETLDVPTLVQALVSILARPEALAQVVCFRPETTLSLPMMMIIRESTILRIFQRMTHPDLVAFRQQTEVIVTDRALESRRSLLRHFATRELHSRGVVFHQELQQLTNIQLSQALHLLVSRQSSSGTLSNNNAHLRGLGQKLLHFPECTQRELRRRRDLALVALSRTTLSPELRLSDNDLLVKLEWSHRHARVLATHGRGSTELLGRSMFEVTIENLDAMVGGNVMAIGWGLSHPQMSPRRPSLCVGQVEEEYGIVRRDSFRSCEYIRRET